jgi:uncharacterized protein HemX
MSTPRNEDPESSTNPTDETPAAGAKIANTSPPSSRETNVVEMNSSGASSSSPSSPSSPPSTSSPILEIPEADEDDVAKASATPSEAKRSGGRGTVLLLVLLAMSVAIHFYQFAQQRSDAAQAADVELALDRAMERIDSETIRANQAEGALTEVDRSVDKVQERIADLQSALSELSDATKR